MSAYRTIPKEDQILLRAAALGIRIRSLRKAARLSQTALSEKTGVSQPMISMVESGDRIASLETLVTLLDALGARLVVQRVRW